jgi:two-component system, LytTR family, response regulator
VPAVIFVTAFDRYALQAFEQHALDYLLKPFSDERFAIVLDRTRVRLRERTFASMAGRLSDLLLATAPAGAAGSTSRQLVVRDAGRTIVIPHDDLVWIEAEDYCARLHLRGRTLLVRDSLRALADSLDGAGFVRVHRSAIANLACIREIEPLASGDQRLTLNDGTVLKISRTYRAHVVKAVGKLRD